MRGAINSGSLAHDQLDVRVAGVVEAGTNVALAHTECTTPKGSCGGQASALRRRWRAGRSRQPAITLGPTATAVTDAAEPLPKPSVTNQKLKNIVDDHDRGTITRVGWART